MRSTEGEILDADFLRFLALIFLLACLLGCLFGWPAGWLAG